MKALTREQRDRIEELIRQMTTEEKIGQLNQISPSIVGGFEVSFEELIEMMTDGSARRNLNGSWPGLIRISMMTRSAPAESGPC